MDAQTRDFVRRRAGQRCEYCHFPERALPYLVFHVDHIIAKQHVDEVSEDPQSLAWACSECNYHKGPNLVSIDPESKQQANLFNPRHADWSEHFSIEDGTVVGLTPTGRATARLLNMNAPRLVRLRGELIEQGSFDG
jgi:HNH endonuclease